MNKRYTDFLARALSGKHAIQVSTIQRVTKNGRGFNLLDQARQSYYMHTGSKVVIPLCTTFIFTYQPSIRCEGRLDVIDCLKIHSLQDFVGQLWDDTLSQSRLIANYYSHPVLGAEIRKKIAENFPENENAFKDLLALLDGQAIRDFIQKVDIAYLPWCLDYPILPERLYSYLFRVPDHVDKKTRLKIKRLAEENGDKILAELFYLSFPEEMEVKSDFFEVSKLFVRLDKKILSAFLDNVWQCSPRKNVIINNLYHDASLGPIIQLKIMQELPSNGMQLANYMEPFNREVRGAVAGVLSERLKPWCLGLETLSEKVVW